MGPGLEKRPLPYYVQLSILNSVYSIEAQSTFPRIHALPHANFILHLLQLSFRDFGDIACTRLISNICIQGTLRVIFNYYAHGQQNERHAF
jgi:hypothetical protein